MTRRRPVVPAPRAERSDIILFLRLQFPGRERFGPGKAQLLAAIDASGSISEAARSLRMSYRRAWLLVADTNTLFGREVVSAAPGGRHGGGAALTPFGRELLACYGHLTRAVERAARSDLRQLAAWARRSP